MRVGVNFELKGSDLRAAKEGILYQTVITTGIGLTPFPTIVILSPNNLRLLGWGDNELFHWGKGIFLQSFDY
jgi:hypothetical protein